LYAYANLRLNGEPIIMKKIKELAFPLLIVLFILFINMNEISQPSTHAITNKMYKYTQKIYHHIYKMNDNKNTKTVYTLQTGSFIKVNDAQQQYILIMNSLNKKNLDYLRIEKVGDFYAVRLGKFKDNSTAKELVQVVKPHLSSVISLKAHIKDDRIIRLYDKEIL
jgi:cell division protein FtsN